MGVRFPSASSTTIVTVNPASATEAILVTTPPLNLPLDFAQVFIHWYAVGTTGATITAITTRLRRGAALTSTRIDVGGVTFTVSAGIGFILSGCYIDTPGAAAGVQYSFTTQGTGAASGLAINDVCLLAYVL
jgi:hypothetical protein